MAPPPVTPSPHRFLVNKSGVPKPMQATPLSGTHNFNARPRFSFPTSQSSSEAQPICAPSLSRFKAARQTLRRHDSIEDPNCEPSHEVDGSMESVEEYGEDQLYDNDELAYNLESRQTKRRRLSRSPTTDKRDEEISQAQLDPRDNDDIFSSSASVVSSPPVIQHSHRASKLPRFLLRNTTPQMSSTSTTETTQPAFLKAPKFRPSEAELNAAHADPLPDHFSPHRRGQKYLAGGLAAEVQGWLVDIENRSADHTIKRKSTEETWAVKFVVDGISGNERAGMTITRGRQIHSNGGTETVVDNLGTVDVILAGEGFGEGLSKGGTVEKRSVVGIKAPVWEVVIDGRKWGVGVNWRILHRGLEGRASDTRSQH